MKELSEKEIIKAYKKKGFRVYRVGERLFIKKGQDEMNFLFASHEEMIEFLIIHLDCIQHK